MKVRCCLTCSADRITSKYIWKPSNAQIVALLTSPLPTSHSVYFLMWLMTVCVHVNNTMWWVKEGLHLAAVKSWTNTCRTQVHIYQNKKNKGRVFLLLPEMSALLSHGCLMLLVAVPPQPLFRQLEASSRRESWYLCWGFQTDHRQEGLLPGRRQHATDTNFSSWLFRSKCTGSGKGPHKLQVRPFVSRGRLRHWTLHWHIFSMEILWMLFFFRSIWKDVPSGVFFGDS